MVEGEGEPGRGSGRFYSHLAIPSAPYLSPLLGKATVASKDSDQHVDPHPYRT